MKKTFLILALIALCSVTSSVTASSKETAKFEQTSCSYQQPVTVMVIEAVNVDMPEMILVNTISFEKSNLYVKIEAIDYVVAKVKPVYSSPDHIPWKNTKHSAYRKKFLDCIKQCRWDS